METGDRKCQLDVLSGMALCVFGSQDMEQVGLRTKVYLEWWFLVEGQNVNKTKNKTLGFKRIRNRQDFQMLSNRDICI